MILIKNLIFAKINKRYINKKNYFDIIFLLFENDCHLQV